MDSKEYYRQFVKQLRENLSIEEIKQKSSSIYNKVLEDKEYKRAKCIFIYVSYKNEVDTHNIIKAALSEGKSICVPKIISLKEGMKSVRIEKFSDLTASKYGILEPEISLEKTISPKDIDLAFIPGVAFDSKGGRIGYGGGFYDRFLTMLNKDTPKLALAYNFQVFDEVPMESYDVYIDGIITE